MIQRGGSQPANQYVNRLSLTIQYSHPYRGRWDIFTDLFFPEISSLLDGFFRGEDTGEGVGDAVIQVIEGFLGLGDAEAWAHPVEGDKHVGEIGVLLDDSGILVDGSAGWADAELIQVSALLGIGGIELDPLPGELFLLGGRGIASDQELSCGL